jgi:hypothetical protein
LCWAFCLGWPQTAILLIFASQVARITGKCYWRLTSLTILTKIKLTEYFFVIWDDAIEQKRGQILMKKIFLRFFCSVHKIFIRYQLDARQCVTGKIRNTLHLTLFSPSET